MPPTDARGSTSSGWQPIKLAKDIRAASAVPAVALSTPAGGSEGQKRSDATPRPRIQALSDLIFGLALSIGAILLISSRPTDALGLAESLLGYGWSFFMIALIWLRYTRVMSVLPVEDERLVSMNMVLLFLVSIEPYLFNLIATSAAGTAQIDSGTATSVFALDMGSIFLILSYFTHVLTIEDRKLIPKELLKRYRLLRDSTVASSAMFYVSALPIFWAISIYGVELRVVLWLLTFATVAVRRGVEVRKQDAGGLPGQGQDMAGEGSAGKPVLPTRVRPQASP